MDQPVSVYCTSTIALYHVSQKVPTWRSQRPKSTVIPSSYYSKLIAGSICVTLKDFWIVLIGQDSCYRSLYVIEYSLIARVRTHFGSFDLFTLVWPHSRWEWQAIVPSSPMVAIVFYHVLEVSCYHSFWAVKSQLCLRLVTLGSIIGKCLQVFSCSAQDVKFVRIDF